ncbi:hypothetical protein ACF0H5_007970 [Mactra antiquata]
MMRRSKRAADSCEAIPDKKHKVDLEIQQEQNEVLETSMQVPDIRSTRLGVQNSQSESTGKSCDSEIKTAVSVEKSVDTEDADKSVRVMKPSSVLSGSSSSPKSGRNSIVSPRRSSRAVVPNTRYKDMVDPLKKTAVVKTEVSPSPKVSIQKKSYTENINDTQRSRKLNEHSVTGQARQKKKKTVHPMQETLELSNVFEEIITEETKIDTLAQLNLENKQVLATNGETNSMYINTTTEGPVSGVQVIEINDESAVHTNTDQQLKESEDLVASAADINDDLSMSTYDPAPEPQIIVIPNESGKTASKIIIPKDPYRARLEQAFENNSSSMIFGPSTGKFKSRKLIVTPTHTHTSKKEAQKAKLARLAESVTPVSNTTSSMYPWIQQSDVNVPVGQIMNVPEKQTNTKVQEVSISSTVSQVIPIPTENTSVGSNIENTDISVTQPLVNKPRTVKIVYVKASTDADGKNTVTVNNVTSADLEMMGKDNEVVRTDIAQNIQSMDTLKSDTTNEDELEELKDDSIDNSEQENIETSPQISTTDSSVYVNSVDQSTADDSLPLEQKIANTLCQVVEYKDPRSHHPSSSTIEYVLLDNKMVPIHKPYTVGPHGRIHTGRQTFPPQRLVPGRIEGVKTSVSDGTLLPTISTTITQTGGETVHSYSGGHAHENRDAEFTAEKKVTVVSGQDEREKILPLEQPLANHGYIDQQVLSTSPPQIVEISTEAFSKEVYGDSFTLDPSSGELLTENIVVTNGNQIIQSSTENVHIINPTIETTSGDNTVNIKDVIELSEADMSDTTNKLVPIQNDGNVFLESIKYFNQPDASMAEHPEKTTNIDKDSIVRQIITSHGDGNTMVPNSGKRPTIVKVKVINKQAADDKTDTTDGTDAPIHKLPHVNITPVRAYTNLDTDINKKEMVTKATETENLHDDDERNIPENAEKSKDGQFHQCIVVHLPEGTEIKQYHTRNTRKETNFREPVTLDSDGMYVCVDCGHKTDRRGNWMKHRRKHLGIRPHACPKCPYKAATSSNLKRHLQIHDDVRNFQCHYCNLLFRQKIHLERHLKYKHEEKNIKCPLCDFVCASENPDLKIHIRRRHMPHEGALNAFTCDVCGLMTISKKDLKQHMKFHKNGPELKLFCEHCSFVTDCVSRLRRHMLIHTKERPYQCGMCMYRASQKEHVLRHMRSRHDIEMERNHRKSLIKTEGQTSSATSIVAGALPTQTSTSSNGTESEFGPFEKSDFSSTDKIFACNYCSMKFAKLINLYKHLYAQHKHIMPEEGPNDYQCVVCDFHTTSKKNLLVHMRKHNIHDHTPPTHVYSCVLCRYMNPRRRNLFQHMKKKHGIEIIMKDDGLNCYVTLDSNAVHVQGQDPGKTNVIALSDIVTTQTMTNTHLEFMDESSEDAATIHAEKISIDNIDHIIPIEEMGSYVVSESGQDSQDSNVTQVAINSLHVVQEHEAAEAIEGLQALAEQAGILETQNIDNDMTEEVVAPNIEISPTIIMNDGEIGASPSVIETGEITNVEQIGISDENIQLSSDQLNQLSSGDYVEINGEVYKVEIAPSLQ